MYRSTRGTAAVAACLLAVTTTGCLHEDVFGVMSPADAAEGFIRNQAEGTSHEGVEAATMVSYAHALDSAIVATDRTRRDAVETAYWQNACVGQTVDVNFASRMNRHIVPMLTATPQRLQGWHAYMAATSVMPSIRPGVDACNGKIET